MESTSSKDEQNNQEDSDSSEMDETEPRLKYVRIRNDLEHILQNDAASCIAVHPKFLCLGSHWGMIHLLDHQGNNIKSKMLQAHTVAVNQISIDYNGDFIASCSDDGKVFIYGLYSTENNHNMSMGRLVKSIAIDPNYKSGSGRRFITGDDKLILYEKTFLARMKPTVLCEAEGGVRSVAWFGHFVAWASDTGVRVYDLDARCSLGLIKWSCTAEVSPEHYRCNLQWSDDKTLLIGWVDIVRICHIRKRTMQEMVNRDLPEFVVDPVSTFQVDFYISGIAPLKNQLILLGCLKELDEDGKNQRPTLHVVEPKYQDFSVICANSLTLRGYKEYSCNDYHLDCLKEENRFFIVSPKDIVVASLYDTDDRIEWLLSHGKFEQALEAVTANNGKDCKRHTVLDVGRIYLDHLLACGRYDEAGKLCLKVLERNKKLWEEEVYKFARVHQLRSISSYLPRGDVILDPLIYEMVLYEYLKMDPDGFLQLVKEWSPNLYTVAAVVNGVLEHLLVHNQRQNVLLEALAILYIHDGKYDKALAMYLKLRHKDVFQLIQKYQLYNSVYDMIEGLMDLDTERAIQFFLEKDRVPSDTVVQKLQHNHRYLYLYLDALDKRDTKDSKGKYHGLLVRLYADYSRDKLLPLLRRSDNYPIQQALDICSQRRFYPEMVYLLGRIGNTSEALALMTRELNDMESAIVFCQEHDDEELWNDLINYSLDKPAAITFLLQKIGTYVDPRLMVQRIEPTLEIPGLKKALVKMMCDYNLQVSVQEGCKKILSNDYFNLHERLVHCHQNGIFVDDDQMCGACHRKIIVREPRNIVVFYCKHCFHEDCLPNFDLIENCVICNSQKEMTPGRK
ncbi:PREDICTED: vacuolar protein sorting-associated protein 41 homolog [Atta cephalotes]|uniref:Vacuolar protein sorting-associated protein 41 homolog n=1 Tax=Atta cephalotes TaxID=12957 RepID=A0A158NL78_ATTCE|nr:PREDICTED: vacuolar protein sorting-associated protein 41 homolog [Atta cephalotes]XP_018047526.1 PREDICTED: vacuolar protein sorting-associated protein 41 homolog isoform X1 [Atta colombica]XP_018047528.1 PREDICTED: vacuolar protein sorting-associated protein 41 homolog isoform X1 [Atta colombica]